MTITGLPRRARVRTGRDFDRIFKFGQRLGTPLLALHWRHEASDTEARLGLAVSRKVDKRAVARVRIKRLLREQFRHARAHLAPGDYVLVARPGAAQAAPEALRRAFDDLLRRFGALSTSGPALPPPQPAGTMPVATPPAAPPSLMSAPDSRGG